jgi:hypothetical protein
MERKAGTASTDEKKALRIAKVVKQKRMITTRRKNSNSGVTHPEKNMLRLVLKTERTSLRITKDEPARCNVESVCDGTTSNVGGKGPSGGGTPEDGPA